MEEQIAEILNLGPRSCKNISTNKDLCERILNEKPINIQEAFKKYNISERTMRRFIDEGMISSFSNKPGKNGTKIFIFENELQDVIGKTIYNMDGKGTFKSINETFRMYFTIIEPILNEKDAAVLKALLIDRKTYKVIAEEFDLSKVRIRQRLQRANKKIFRFVKVQKEFDELEQGIIALRKEKVYLLDYLYKLKSKNKNKIRKLELLNDLNKITLVDMDLSVRALNCLKAADVVTLGELVKYDRNDVLKFRNFGKKTLQEIDEYVSAKGLEFGMFKDI